MIAQTNDCLRNCAIARWAVGNHLDFVSRFTFSTQTNTQFENNDLQPLIEQWASEPAEWDIAPRHTRGRIVRMTEASDVARGDHLLLKLGSGRLQQVESDRIRDIVGIVDDTIVHGVKVDSQRRELSYQVWKRSRAGSYEFDREVSADDVLFHGYFATVRSDQVRGIGLITAGLNDLIDAYEWQDLTTATARHRTALAMIVSSNALDAISASAMLVIDTRTRQDLAVSQCVAVSGGSFRDFETRSARESRMLRCRRAWGSVKQSIRRPGPNPGAGFHDLSEAGDSVERSDAIALSSHHAGEPGMAGRRTTGWRG